MTAPKEPAEKLPLEGIGRLEIVDFDVECLYQRSDAEAVERSETDEVEKAVNTL